MIKGVKKLNNLTALKINKKSDSLRISENKLYFFIVTFFSFVLLIFFHSNTQKITPKPIFATFRIFETPNILMSKFVSYISDLKHFYKTYNSVISSNISLKSRILELQSQNDQLTEARDNFKIDINLENNIKYTTVKVISSNDSFGYVLINKGLSDGIHSKSLVLKNGTLYGFVIEALNDRSYVLPIYDSKFRIPVKIISSFQNADGNKISDTIYAIAEHHNSKLYLKYFNKEPDFEISGGEILTSAEAGSVIPNAYVGLVEKQQNSYIVNNHLFKSFGEASVLLVLSNKNLDEKFEEQVENEYLSVIDSAAKTAPTNQIITQEKPKKK